MLCSSSLYSVVFQHDSQMTSITHALQQCSVLACCQPCSVAMQPCTEKHTSGSLLGTISFLLPRFSVINLHKKMLDFFYQLVLLCLQARILLEKTLDAFLYCVLCTLQVRNISSNGQYLVFPLFDLTFREERHLKHEIFNCLSRSLHEYNMSSRRHGIRLYFGQVHACTIARYPGGNGNPGGNGKSCYTSYWQLSLDTLIYPQVSRQQREILVDKLLAAELRYDKLLAAELRYSQVLLGIQATTGKSWLTSYWQLSLGTLRYPQVPRRQRLSLGTLRYPQVLRRQRQILVFKLLAAELGYPQVSLGTQATTANPGFQAISS